MSEEQTSFKVTDRRLFNADGSPREVPEEERPESDSTVSAEAGSGPSAASAEAAAPRASTASGPSDTGSTAQAQTETAQAQTEPRHTPSTPSEEEDELDAENPASFVNFIMSIASNAASSLGMMEHPVTHKREVDLELAKHWIDILGMLQHKTRGNLHSQEERIVEGLLSDLRMQYVSLANTASPKAAGAYTGRDIIGG